MHDLNNRPGGPNLIVTAKIVSCSLSSQLTVSRSHGLTISLSHYSLNGLLKKRDPLRP
jgi:hypothetical protein